MISRTLEHAEEYTFVAEAGNDVGRVAAISV
jgi:hypothetical protein